MWPILAAAAFIIGLVYLDKKASAAPAPTVAPTSPPQSNFLQLITTPATVSQYQTIVASGLASDAMSLAPLYPTPLTWADYNASDVDGNPASPRWTAILSKFQKAMNYDITHPPAGSTPRTDIPQGMPKLLREDGALDYATAIWIQNA